MENVWKDAGVSVPVGRWAQEPCWRCHRQPEDGEVVQLDVLAQTVLCARCRDADIEAFKRVLLYGHPTHIDGEGHGDRLTESLLLETLENDGDGA